MNTVYQFTVQTMSIDSTLPIFWTSLSSELPKLNAAKEAIQELRVSHPENTPSNVRSVYMSPWKSHQLNAKLLPICDLAVECATQAITQYMNTDLAKLNWALRVIDCWGAIYEEADHTVPHTHFPSDISAVLYLEADEGCAPIVFANKVAVQPKPNMLIMFPGILLHSVPNNSAGKRTVLAMNMHKFPSFPTAPVPVDPAQADQQSAPMPGA
jgi:hypothetical protein